MWRLKKFHRAPRRYTEKIIYIIYLRYQRENHFTQMPQLILFRRRCTDRRLDMKRALPLWFKIWWIVNLVLLMIFFVYWSSIDFNFNYIVYIVMIYFSLWGAGAAGYRRELNNNKLKEERWKRQKPLDS